VRGSRALPLTHERLLRLALRSDLAERHPSHRHRSQATMILALIHRELIEDCRLAEILFCIFQSRCAFLSGRSVMA